MPYSTIDPSIFRPFRCLRGLLLFLSASVLLWTGCADRSTESSESLVCTPDTLYRGQTLRLRLPTPHGGDLAIVDPKGTVYFAYREGTPHPMLSPPAPSGTFTTRELVRFETERVEMKPFIYDARPAIRVFRQTGPYEIRLGSHLVATDQAPAHRCTVYYVHEQPNRTSPMGKQLRE